jgi:hypothetical protein
MYAHTGFYGFDGIDWDIEGNDDFSSPYNHFTVECLDLMGRFSQLAKEKGSYIVSMVPAGKVSCYKVARSSAPFTAASTIAPLSSQNPILTPPGPTTTGLCSISTKSGYRPCRGSTTTA